MEKGKVNGWKILIAAELFCVLLMFLGCFGGEKLLYSAGSTDMTELVAEDETAREYKSSSLELKPGVYCLRILTELETGETVFVDMKAEQAYYNTFRNNGMVVFAGNNSAEFLIYVLDKVPEASIHCRFTGTDAGSLLQAELYKTKLGNRMMLFLSIVIFFVLDFFIVFRKGIMEKKISGKQQVVFWTLTAGVLISIFPYMTDYITLGADSVYHLSRIAFLKDALQQGSSFPVRMQGTWLYGHGYATSLFYGDLFLYFPACLMLLGFSILNAYKIFLLAVLTAAAVISYYCFKECVKDEYAALFGSMVYLLIPYRLLNLYNRAATGEYLAMTFYPVIYCGVYMLYTRDETSKEYRNYKWYLILGMSAILQSHLISTELITVLIAVVCVVFWKKTFRKETFCQLTEAAVITLLLNAWFWVPLLYMMRADTYVLESVIERGGAENGTLAASFFQLLPNSGGAQTGMLNAEPLQLGAGAVMMLIIYYLWRLKHKEKNRMCDILAGFSMMLLVMSTSYIPWEAVRKLPGIGYVISSLQFPYRWLAPASVMTGMFAAFFFLLIRDKGGKFSKTALGVIVLISVGSAVFYVNDYALNHSPTFLYNVENMGTVSVVNGEYLLEDTMPEDFYYHDPAAEEGLLWSDYEKSGTNVILSLHNTSAETRSIEIPLLGYKGYGVKEENASGGSFPWIMEERGNHGDLRIAVPGGYQGTIRISYVGSVLFHAAEAVSLVSLMAAVGIYCYKRRKNYEDRNENRRKR